ncbi:MAG: RecQ family ATP-dependent DNA helicase [Bacteroidales bacterium]|nr:RecQ family ATP-dependent DNA helicase [Bacteroidales bacterium]
MSPVIFIDLEVNPQNNKVLDYGAVTANGETLHTTPKADFEDFTKGYQFICGHNVCHHDSNFFRRGEGTVFIDTLYFSPLLFPEKPYHRLLKDDKILTDELSNPLNDAIKAKELFYDEINAFKNLDARYRQILVNLLHKTDEFSGMFQYIDEQAAGDTLSIIKDFFDGKICENAPLEYIVNNNPVPLAYALAIITTSDKTSIIPHWVHRQFPLVETVMQIVRNTPCGHCAYCQNLLDPHKNLKRIFGFDDFRKYEGEPLQENAVKAAIDNQSLLAIFPTGGGKSLTFQLPALIAGITERALTVVISPLQSLMKDQVDNLEKRGIADAVTINGLLSPLERQEAIERVDSGVASLLYISPESLRSRTIEKLLMSRQIARFVIDEAHCFSAWGQDFRVDYLYIGDYIRELAKKKGVRQIPVSCFTATAKQKVISDIRDYFHEKLGCELQIFATSASRTNLRYQVLFKETDEDKYTALRDLIETKNCPTIVYVSRTKRTIILAEKLNRDGIPALAFNGKMESKTKQQNQDAFIHDKVQVIVATSAFGMGVDKSNVRLVIHYDISDSLENYVQEAGRAGRDPKLDAECYVLYNDNDLDKHFILNNQTKVSCAEINQVWRTVKNMTRTRKSFCSSALEIARAAGWDYEVSDVETRVKTALQALENAGYIQRGKNSPRIYATSILVKNYEEADRLISSSKLFLTDAERTNAKRIIKSLISSKYIAQAGNDDAESRVDYLADILGITKENVISAVQTMRQEKILKDDRDISAYIDSPKDSPKTLILFRDLSFFILDVLNSDGITLNLKQLNEDANRIGLKSTVKNLKTILLFWKIKSYIKLVQDTTDSITVQPQITLALLREKQKKIFSLADFIIRYLIERYTNSQKNEENLILFSIVELYERYNTSFLKEFDADVHDIEEALLFLAKINSMKLEGGFLVLYMGLNIKRLNLDNKKQYTKEDYKQMAEYYRHKIEQIHIVGEFANMMVKSYDAALMFVKDYFQIDYKKFLSKYFTADRQREIERNITPKKYRELFDTLSVVQKRIIDDDTSPHIVATAGPGSGKTRVLVHKLASLLLMEDVKHEQLLMLTFSRASATEFKRRLVALIGNAANFVEIKTFHSYCFDLIGQIGKIEEVSDVVPKATQMILNYEVEPNKITKKVLVIDEAQDMDADEFALVEALMEHNDNLRVIAVGDDDQNIYEFRGSSSENFCKLITKYGAKQYDLVDNYRSVNQIVNFANNFAATISHRMKTAAIKPVRKDNGEVVFVKHCCSGGFEISLVNSLKNNRKEGSCCVLTTTNSEALSILGLLLKNGIKSKLIQSNDGFDLGSIAELKFFVKTIKTHLQTPKVSPEIWEFAKKSLSERYSNSACLNLVSEIIRTFEENNRDKYLTDFQIFLRESSMEDFYRADDSTVTVSTVHKAKGREFDNVYMYLNDLNINEDAEKRRLYVGFTRAKNSLHVDYRGMFLDQFKSCATSFTVDNTEYQKPEQLIVALTHKDIYLDFFKDKKTEILQLISGTSLDISEGGLKHNGKEVLRFSKAFCAKLLDYEKLGYTPLSAKIRFVLSWFCEGDGNEYAIILPMITMGENN